MPFNTFKKIIKLSQTNSSDKINIYIKSLIKGAFEYYSRSLFKADLLVFGLYYIKSLFSDSQMEWDFIMGTIAINNSQINIPPYLNPERREIFTNFGNNFPNLLHSLKFDNKAWESWANCQFPDQQLQKLLSQLLGNNHQVNAIQRLIIIQIFRPDRLESAIREYILEVLDLNSIVPTSMSLPQLIAEESNIKVPILFVTSLGSDPSKELEDFSSALVGRENYLEIPLGGGDNEKIIQTVEDGIKKGLWICLKNLHLAISWLPTLEKSIKNIKDPHPNFRLWLTSEPHVKFSGILLESCVKLTYETPPGIKKSLERIYQIWSGSLLKDPDIISSSDRMQALFSIAFLHALLQERRTYIPQGWSKFYEFSYSDLKVSSETLVKTLKEGGNNVDLMWRNVRGLVSNSYYGGRIDNDFDFLVLNVYVNKILDPKVAQGKLLNKLQLPNSKDLNAYLDIIKKLPDNDDPELFGLPLNVDRSVQRYISSEVLYKLNMVYTINSESSKFEKEKWAEKLKPVIILWKSIYSDEAIDTCAKLLSKINEEDPINICIKSEANQIINLLKIISTFF